jgi:pyruvyltransferase
VKSRGDALVISHIDDQAPNLQNSNIEFVYATEPFIKIVSRIAGANKVITSSLHGKILADAFQVPNVVYQGKTTSKFKFDDYALGSGNEGFTILENLDQALGSAPLPALKFEGVTERLLGAFPFYLWD